MRQINAEIKQGRVFTGDEIEVPDAEKLCKGERDSKGVILVDETGAKYIAIPVEDIADLKGFIELALEVSKELASTPASQGATPAAGNPQITAKIQQLESKLAEFKQT